MSRAKTITGEPIPRQNVIADPTDLSASYRPRRCSVKEAVDMRIVERSSAGPLSNGAFPVRAVSGKRTA